MESILLKVFKDALKCVRFVNSILCLIFQKNIFYSGVIFQKENLLLRFGLVGGTNHASKQANKERERERTT